MKGKSQEEAVKEILREQGWNVFNDLSDGRPVDVYAELGDMAIIIEVKDDKGEYSINEVGTANISKIHNGKYYKYDKDELNRATTKVIELNKGRGKFVPLLRALVINSIAGGYAARFNSSSCLFLVQYKYFPQWLKALPKVMLGSPINDEIL